MCVWVAVGFSGGMRKSQLQNVDPTSSSKKVERAGGEFGDFQGAAYVSHGRRVWWSVKISVGVARAMWNVKREQDNQNYLSRWRAGILVTDDEPLFSRAGRACSSRPNVFCESDMVEVALAGASKRRFSLVNGHVTRIHLQHFQFSVDAEMTAHQNCWKETG